MQCSDFTPIKCGGKEKGTSHVALWKKVGTHDMWIGGTKALAHVGMRKHITISPCLHRQDWSTHIDKMLATKFFLVFLSTILPSTAPGNRRCQPCILDESTAENFTTRKNCFVFSGGFVDIQELSIA